MMNSRIAFVLTALFLSACSTAPSTNNSVGEIFCDRYFVYPMCAQDITGNGRTDLVYFEDSQEIFLFNEKLVSLAPTNLSMHECAQVMDKKLIDAASRLLTIDEDTSFFRRREIKNGIFYHYMRYLPRVSKCNPDIEPLEEEIEDDFGVEENDIAGTNGF